MVIKWILVFVTLIGTEPNAQKLDEFDLMEDCLTEMHFMTKKMKDTKADSAALVTCIPTKIDQKA